MVMNIPDYHDCDLPMREDRTEAHLQAWQHICSPGAQFTAEARIDMVREARCALTCTLCAARRGALSSNAVSGEHDIATALPASVIDLIHRMCTDPSRISRPWFDQTMATGLTPGQYVEAVGVVAVSVIIDTFSVAVGLGLPPSLDPMPGEPDGQLNPDAIDDGAWVPILVRERDDMANIVRALGLVPGDWQNFWRVFRKHYRTRDGIEADINRPQQELVASRISALNQCFY